jgi:uncharacterized protein YxjI
MIYNIEQIQTLKLRFEKSFLDKAQIFFNLLKYTFTKRPIKTEVQNWSTYNYILDKEYNFNMQRYPGCSYTSSTGSIVINGVTYETEHTERLLKKVGTKYLYQIKDTYTIDEEESTSTSYVYKDAAFISDCQILDDPTLEDFINKIQQQSHAT